MKLGIIGSGKIVDMFFNLAYPIEGIDVYAICGREKSKEKIEGLKDKYNITKTYYDLDEFLKDDNIDIAYVALPNSMHYLTAKKCLEAGKNVFLEKPFTSTLRQAKKLLEIAEENKVFILEAAALLYNPNYDSIKNVIKSLGPLKRVQIEFQQYSSRYDAFLRGEILPAFDVNMSGGALYDLGIYNIHTLTKLLGKPKDVKYEPRIVRGIDTSGILNCYYDGFVATLIAGKDKQGDDRNVFEGEKGTLIIEGKPNHLSTYKLIRNNIEENVKCEAEGNFHHLEFEALRDIYNNHDLKRIVELNTQTLVGVEILENARKSCGLVFPDDINI